MTEIIASLGLRAVDGVNLLILLMVVWTFIRVVSSDENTVVWADFISSRGMDGKQRGDVTKVGQLTGIVVSAVSVLMYADNKSVEPAGLSMLLGVALLYLGGVSAYSSYIRSKQNGNGNGTGPAEPPKPAP